MRQISRVALVAALATIVLSLGSGCAVNRATARLVGDADLAKVKKVYVVKFQPDRRYLNKIMADRLVAMGYEATTGEESEVPQGVDAVLTYRDKWMWDITNYMIELTVTVNDPGNKYALAVGNSYHTSLTRKSPEGMIEEVLTNIFKNAKKGDL